MFCAFRLGLHPRLGEKLDQIRVKTFFFCSSPNFGQKIELILDGTISDSDLWSSQIFWSFWPPLPPPPPPFQNPAYATGREHSITTITCNECYEWTENLKLQTLQLPFKNVFFPFYLLFCLFVSFKFLRIKYRKHFRHVTIKQLSNNKKRKRKICKEIVFRVKITCKSNRGQNDPCYALM